MENSGISAGGSNAGPAHAKAAPGSVVSGFAELQPALDYDVHLIDCGAEYFRRVLSNRQVREFFNRHFKSGDCRLQMRRVKVRATLEHGYSQKRADVVKVRFGPGFDNVVHIVVKAVEFVHAVPRAVESGIV